MFIVGDIHGDVLILLEIGKLTGLFGCDVMDKLIRIHRNYKSLYNQDDILDFLGNDLGLHHIHWTKENREEIYFLGDVVDNYRLGMEVEYASSEVPNNNMAMNGELYIVATLLRLKQEAIIQGGNLYWVIGNHDLANAMNDDTLTCSHYTTLDQCDTVDKNLYNSTRSTIIKDTLIEMNAKAVYIVDGLLLCHGGLAGSFIEECRKRGLIHDDTRLLDIEKVNQMYRKAIMYSRSPEFQWVREQVYTGRDLTWCRPLQLEKWLPEEVFPLIHTPVRSMVVAHTIQDKIGRILHHNAFGDTVDGTMSLTEGEEPWYEGEDIMGVFTTKPQKLVKHGIYMMDLAMSRAFDDSTVTPYDESYCTIGVMEYKDNTVKYHARLHPRCI
jgi:hypothetical protein